MFGALKQLFSPSLLKRQAHEAYVQIVTQARQPVFYHDWQVDDSLDGRFDALVLHLFLVLERCEGEDNDETRYFSRYLSEIFFADMDRSLREMGASDTGVGIRIKAMAQAFYGRMKAYRDAIGDETALAEALKRNVYRDRDIAPEIVASLAAYMGRNYLAFKAMPVAVLMHGGIQFSG